MTSIKSLANWLGRKFIALVFVAFLAVAAAAFKADKLSAIELTLAALYASYVGAHSATDIMAKKTPAKAAKDDEGNC